MPFLVKLSHFMGSVISNVLITIDIAVEKCNCYILKYNMNSIFENSQTRQNLVFVMMEKNRVESKTRDLLQILSLLWYFSYCRKLI